MAESDSAIVPPATAPGAKNLDDFTRGKLVRFSRLVKGNVGSLKPNLETMTTVCLPPKMITLLPERALFSWVNSSRTILKPTRAGQTR